MPDTYLCKNDAGYLAYTEVDLILATNRTTVGRALVYRTMSGILHVTLRPQCPYIIYSQSDLTTDDTNHFLLLSYVLNGGIFTRTMPMVSVVRNIA